MNRGIIYLATHPVSKKAIIGHGYHLESVKISLKNAKSPGRATYPASNLIKEFGGIDAWNWAILYDISYHKKKELFNVFLKEHDLIKYKYPWEALNELRVIPVNHEIVDWVFEEIVW